MNNTTMNSSNIVANDNQAYWIDFFNFLNKVFSQYGFGFMWLFGNIGLVLTCIVFCQPNFRSNSCAIYFIACSVAQFFTYNFALVTRIIQFGYNVQAINTMLWFCKLRQYFSYIAVAALRSNIILAPIDCYFASSRDALRRQWSSPKMAFRLIIGSTVFWCFIYVQVIIFFVIENGQCLPQSGFYTKFFSIYMAIDTGILPTFLMLTFGLLTIRNIHRTRQRIKPVAVNNNAQQVTRVQGGSVSNKDMQLYKMLIAQVAVFVIQNIASPCYLLYRAFTMNIVKSPLRLTVELFVNNMTFVAAYIGFALIFPTFFIASKMFRRELQQVIQTKIFRQHLRPVTTTGTTARTGREVKPPE